MASHGAAALLQVDHGLTNSRELNEFLGRLGAKNKDVPTKCTCTSVGACKCCCFQCTVM